MMLELTKQQKKQIRILINLGIRRDYIDGIKKMKAITDTYDENTSDPRDVYMKLYSTLTKKDEEIATRYNDLTGSKYLMCLMHLVEKGVISFEEIDHLDEQLKAVFHHFLQK
jgi:hypothetical protein